MKILALIALMVLAPTALAICGGTFNAYATKEITSPNYPSNYDAIPPGDPFLECDFIIVAPGRYRIDLELVDADLGNARLAIYDDNFDDFFLASWHPSYMLGHNGPFRSSGQRMAVRFTVQDDGTAAKGFKATITLAPPGASCGGPFVATTSASEITSPNYPVYYDMDNFCLWKITAPEGRSIDLTFHDISLHYAYLVVFSGAEYDASVMELFYHDDVDDEYQPAVPYTVHCPINEMMVLMENGDFPARGFRATYKLGCGGNFSADTTDEILTPNYPAGYDAVPVGDAKLECHFQITAPAGYRPVLTFQDVELGTASVVIYDEPDGHIFDESPDLPYAYTSQVIEVVFTVYPDNTAARGFKGNLKMVPEEPVCGSDLSASSRPGQIASPYYPAVYPNDADCSWVITAPEGNAVTLTLLDVDTESGSDYVDVHDGPSSASTYLGSFSSTPESPLTSTGAQMLVHFTSDDGYTHRGFKATYVGRDIDECATGTHECNIYAVCTNTNGGYNCKCKSGYTGDGSICTDVDECSASAKICGRYDTCRNVNGGYRCLDQSIVPEDVGEQAPSIVSTYFRTDTPPSEYLLVVMLHERELNTPNLDLTTRRLCGSGSTGIYTVQPSELTYDDLEAEFTADRQLYFRAGGYRSTISDFYSGMWGRKCFAARSVDVGYMDTVAPEIEVTLAYWARKGMRMLYNNYYYVVFSSRPASALGTQLINDVFKMKKNKQKVDLSTRTIFITDDGGSLMVNDFLRDTVIPYPVGLDLQEVLFGPLKADPCDKACVLNQGIAAVDRHGECLCNCFEGFTGEFCHVTDDICREAVQDTLCENDSSPAIDGQTCVCSATLGEFGVF